MIVICTADIKWRKTLDFNGRWSYTTILTYFWRLYQWLEKLITIYRTLANGLFDNSITAISCQSPETSVISIAASRHVTRSAFINHNTKTTAYSSVWAESYLSYWKTRNKLTREFRCFTALLSLFVDFSFLLMLRTWRKKAICLCRTPCRPMQQ